MLRMTQAAIAATVLVAVSGPGFAADDSTFLQTAIGVNLAEIQMGKLAGSKSPTEAVRSYGATLVTDHQNANDDAVALAKKLNVEVPDAPSTDAQSEYDRIAKLSGQEFDKAFAETMIDGHKKAIDYFADKADDAANDVTAYAEKTLPTLRKHLATARSLQSGTPTAMQTEDADRDQASSAVDVDRDQVSAVDSANDNQGAAIQANRNALFISAARSDWRASTLLGMDIYGNADQGQAIGQISDLLVGNDGRITAVVVDVGGFLGIGEKSVGISFDRIEQMPGEGANRRLVYSGTRQQLETAPAIDLTDVAMADTARRTDTEVVNEPMAVGVTPPATSMNTPDRQASGDRMDINEGPTPNMRPANATELTADALIGTTVYGAADQNVGEVGDVVLTQDGKIDAVVLDVGGFLGLGEKPVAIAFDDLRIMADQNGSLYAYTVFTQDQLEAAPSYDKDSYVEDRDRMRVRSSN